MLKTIDLNSGKYVYRVTYKQRSGLPQFSFNERKRVSPKIRITNRLYYDHRDEIVKEIVYPKDLWYTDVIDNDPVEKYTNDIMEFMPDWVKIEIKNLNEN